MNCHLSMFDLQDRGRERVECGYSGEEKSQGVKERGSMCPCITAVSGLTYTF